MAEHRKDLFCHRSQEDIMSRMNPRNDSAVLGISVRSLQLLPLIDKHQSGFQKRSITVCEEGVEGMEKTTHVITSFDVEVLFRIVFESFICDCLPD